jgi:hypothetical protein
MDNVTGVTKVTITSDSTEVRAVYVHVSLVVTRQEYSHQVQ